VKEEKQVEAFMERIRQVHLKFQEKLKARQAKWVDSKFHVGYHDWLYLNKDMFQGSSKKLKPIRYGPFKIMEKVSENAFRLNLPTYLNIDSVLNV